MQQSINLSTINNYIVRLNYIHKLQGFPSFSDEERQEIYNAIRGAEFNKDLISFPYYNDIDNLIQQLRIKYPNNNSFRTYIISISVFLSKFDNLKPQYELTSKLNIEFLNKYNEERNKNIISDEDKGKLISFSDEEINNNINKLTDITDKIIYAFSVYLLRRLEISNLKLAFDETNTDDNFLIVDKFKNPIKFIFNNYKTSKVYKKQTILVPEQIKELLTKYLIQKKIDIGDYVFGLQKNRKLLCTRSNFSNKIKSIFNKLYENQNITNRWIRTAYATETNSHMLDTVRIYEADALKLSHSVKVHHQYIKR